MMEIPLGTTHGLLLSTKNSIKAVHRIPELEEVVFTSDGSVCKFSPSGHKLAVVDPSGLRLLTTDTFSDIWQIPHQSIQLLDFSPSQTYLTTWEKQSDPNLLVWQISTGQLLLSFSHKKFPKQIWPLLVFSQDERSLFRQTPSGLEIYSMPNGVQTGVFNEIQLTAFALHPRNQSLITYSAGDPALIGILQNSAGQIEVQSMTQVAKSSQAQILMSKQGNSFLVWSQTDVDSTGRSYYGEHFLYIGSQSKAPRAVKTTDGPVYDVKWSPVSQQFIEISGFMPAKATLYKGNGSKITTFPQSHKNTVRWNSFGDLILIGGFGNLQGDIEVYERSSLNPVGNCRAELTVACEWAPCGRIFISATMNPRLRVDNGYKIYKYTGELLFSMREQEIWSIQWMPAVFQARPITPRSPVKPPVKREVYRPPGSAEGFAEKFRAAKTAVKPKPQVRDDWIPGLDPEEPKKKRRRKKKKAKEQFTPL